VIYSAITMTLGRAKVGIDSFKESTIGKLMGESVFRFMNGKAVFSSDRFVGGRHGRLTISWMKMP